MSKIPAHNLAGMMTKKEEKACTTGNKQLSDKKEVCSKVKQFLLEEGKRKLKKAKSQHCTNCVCHEICLSVFRGQRLQKEGTFT